ncbi:MAG TPA: hypothetical protein ENF41_04425 [Candidatus Bathyarchaeota archaeon]|nr:hypothetical protein [Candidatus Bathyarchaeota archaeon]
MSKEDKKPFRREKTAKDIIAEICEKYGVKERAKQIILSWCDKVPNKELHPNHFEKLLLTLDSGVTKKEAEIIVEEYEIALRTLHGEKEEYAGRDVFYYSPPEADVPRRYYYDAHGRVSPARPATMFYYPPKPQYTLTPEDIKGIVEKMLFEREKERELQELREKIVKLESSIEKKISDAIKEAVSQLVSVTQPPPNVVTQEDIKELIKELRQDYEKKYLEKMLEVEKEQRERDREMLERVIDSYEKKIEKLEEELKKRSQPVKVSSEGYKDDAVRLLADTISALDLSNRRPLSEIKEIAIKLMPAVSETKPQKRTKVPGKSRIEEFIPEELVEEE